MGESSACLLRSFSQPSPTSSEEKKGNPLHRALTTSISFGRFMSESLDWEKWSAFTHNRYLEEVEKYSKPGSVAEKKAYFEAHYKRRRAAALLEQQKAASEQMNEEKEVSSVSQNDEAVERNLEDIEEVSEPSVFVENPVELRNDFESNGCVVDDVSNQEDESCNNDAPSMRNPPSSSEEKPEVSSSELPANGNASKDSPKPIVPKKLNESDKRTPKGKNSPKESRNKRSSLHMSIAFASGCGEAQRVTSPGLPKSRLHRAPVKKSVNSMVSLTSTRASVNGTFKHLSSIPPPENRRNKTLQGDSNSGSRVLDGKVQSPSTKVKSSTVSAPFVFKSEERAAKRKEFLQKLEQRLKSKESVKEELHEKIQGKTKGSLKDLRHSVGVEVVKRSADIPLIVESSSNLTKKIPRAKPYVPKIQERVAFKAQDNDPRPPWRFSLKTDSSKDVTGKKNRSQISSSTSFSKKSTHENTCPNIQV